MSEYIASVVNLDLKDGSTVGKTIKLNDPREKIVRCRDCKHHTYTTWHRCDLHSIAHEVEPYGFCAWGERVE